FFQKEFDISESPAGNCPRRMIEAPRTEFVLMESRCIFRGFRDSSGSRLLSRMPGLDGPALFPFRYRSGRLNCFLRRAVRAIQTDRPSENMSAPTSPMSIRKGRNQLGPPARDATTQTIIRANPMAQTSAG